MLFSEKDKTILRDAARRVAEIATHPRQDKTKQLWRRMNGLERTRPPVLLLDGTKHETGDKIKLECEGEDARAQEWGLRNRIYKWENLRDDSVWDNTVLCPIVMADLSGGYGIEEDATRPDHVFGSRHFNQVIADGDAPERISMPKITVDWEETQRRYDALCDLYDGILEVRKTGVYGHWFAIMDDFITWRGIEQTFIDMLDRPEWIHSWLDRMCTFQIKLHDQYEAQNVLSLNNHGVWTGSGGLGCTDLLPSDDFVPGHVRTIDQWGHATTQIFSEVSPAMHEEFAIRYEKRYLARFGLSNYGCCEPLERKVDLILENIPNVRKISMSPKADVASGAEAIGRKTVFSWKPNPTMIGMPTWDPDFIRRELRDALEKTRDCVVEIVMKDLHTCCGEVHRMTEWIKIAKELAEEYA